MKKILLKFNELVIVFSTMLYCPVMAFASNEGLGEDASRLVQGPLEHLKNFMIGICYLVGILLIFNGFHKYQEYRRNVQEVPLSTPIFYFVLGVLIILLPLSRYLVKATGQ